MNISLIDYRPSSVLMTSYDPYISLIDLTIQTITIRQSSNTSGQPFSPDAQITINKELDLQSVNVTAKII